MIKTLIIEDEFPAAERLEKLLLEIEPEIEILDKLDSISGSINWLKQNKHPNLVMLDIQLADGLSFEIFKEIQIDSFVIFTTAFDEYAIKAFELNSLDYLLKPIDKVKLSRSIAKFKRLESKTSNTQIKDLLESLNHKSNTFKKRFAINMGTKIKAIETSKVTCFQSLEKAVFLNTLEGRAYPIDYSLDKLESLLNPEDFFRINRQTIIQFTAIEKMNILSKSRVQIELSGSKENYLVSTAKSHSFRLWLDK